MTGDCLQVTTTTESEADARRLGRAAVEARLAACVQVVGPIESTYWWKGRLEQAREWMCLAKTTSDAYPALESFLLANHPYDTPEITACVLDRGSDSYLSWIREETRGSPDEGLV